MQLVTSKTIKFFHNSFKRKFGFSDYTDIDKPSVFFGVYRNSDLRAIKMHNGIKIIWLAGYDASVRNMMVSLKNIIDKNTTIIAESVWIEKDLYSLGIPYRKISLFMDDIYNWKPVPLGKCLYWYKANDSRYGKQYLAAIKKSFPDLDIIINDNTTVTRDKMPEIYSNCFAVVRPTEHDGLSQTVAEAGLMGRMSIWNGEGPFAVNFEGVEGIIKAIERLRTADYNYKLVSKRTRGYFIDNEVKWTDLILELCGTEELDVSKIFNEDHGRCGSIFRIMRRDVVDKMPKLFGDKQFERPYIDEELKRLNLRQLITSKNSGFIVSEWKGAFNKGYPKNITFNTYDKKYN